MSQRIRKIWLATCAFALLLVVGGFSRVHALDVTNSPAQGIQISPVLIDLNADKGKGYDLKITVTNVTASDLVLKGTVNDFKAKDETGNPEVILDNSDAGSSFSFKQWVSVPKDIPLKSKESKVVTITVAVPASAEAGGHYGVIRFSGLPPGESNSNVSIAASVGVLVLARVNGNITEKLSLKDFFIEKDKKRTGLAQNGPLSIVERVQNSGNVHVKPTGNITIKSMFGSTVATLPLNDPAKNILPSSIRRFSQDLNKKWLFGRYTARVEATYGYSNQVIKGSFNFWVIPYMLIFVTILILIIVIFVIKTGLKHYNKSIINKAMNRRR